MMTKKIVLCLVVSVLCVSAKSQQKIKFSSIEQVGILMNKNATSGNIQTVNGIAYKGWFTGAGVAVDFYRFISLPVFIDVRKDLGKTRNKPFVYIDGGVNIFIEEKVNATYKNGGFFDGGIGYTWPNKNARNAFLISMGYSYKSFKTTQYPPVGIGDADPTTYTYKFNRVVMKVGWRF